MPKRLTIADLFAKKGTEKITFITAYDFPMARIAENSGIDLILVGDSVGNNVLGYETTNPVTMDEMICFAKAVRRGAPNTFIVGDMPSGSYQASNRDAVYNAFRFIKEAGMDAVKCEGGQRMAERVRAMSDAGIGVMGHIGYTPQSTNLQGIVQGRTEEGLQRLLDDANALRDAGAFSILLEAVPNGVSKQITQKLDMPIYGIGAGYDVDGVLAIMHDVIGLGNFKSKFAKKFGNAGEEIQKGIRGYIDAVRAGQFPDREHCY